MRRVKKLGWADWPCVERLTTFSDVAQMQGERFLFFNIRWPRQEEIYRPWPGREREEVYYTRDNYVQLSTHVMPKFPFADTEIPLAGYGILPIPCVPNEWGWMPAEIIVRDGNEAQVILRAQCEAQARSLWHDTLLD
jgi:hypothetical protein